MKRLKQNGDTTSARRSFLKRLGALALAAGMPVLTKHFRFTDAPEVLAKNIDDVEERRQTATFALG